MMTLFLPSYGVETQASIKEEKEAKDSKLNFRHDINSGFFPLQNCKANAGPFVHFKYFVSYLVLAHLALKMYQNIFGLEAISLSSSKWLQLLLGQRKTIRLVFEPQWEFLFTELLLFRLIITMLKKTQKEANFLSLEPTSSGILPLQWAKNGI